MHIAIDQELDKTSALELPAFLPEEKNFWLDNTIRKFAKTRYSGINSKRQGFEETQKRMDDLRTLVNFYSPASVTDGSASYPNSYIAALPIPDSDLGDEDYWFTLQEEAEITVDGTATRVGIIECTFDEYRAKIDDPYSEHKLHYATAKPLRLLQNNSVYLVATADYSVTDYYLTYLRKPQFVNIANVASGGLVVGATYGVYSTSTSDNIVYNGSIYYTGRTFVCVTGVLTYTENGTCDVMLSCDLPEHTHDEIVKMTANTMLENIEQPRYKTHMAEVATME